jgi:hypothetical protein
MTSSIVLLKGLCGLFLQRNLELLAPFLQLIEVREVGGIENLDFMKVVKILVGKPSRDVSSSPPGDVSE